MWARPLLDPYVFVPGLAALSFHSPKIIGSQLMSLLAVLHVPPGKKLSIIIESEHLWSSSLFKRGETWSQVQKPWSHQYFNPRLQARHLRPRLIIHIVKRHIRSPLMGCKCLHGLAPEYFSSPLEHHHAARSLRSSQSFLLIVPKSLLKTTGDHAFSGAVPCLSLHIRSCLKLMWKTHLYSIAYNSP